MKIKTFIAKACSKVYKKLFHKPYYDCSDNCKYERQECNDMVYNALISGKPFMLTRYGSIEMNVVNSFRILEDNKSYISKLWDYVTDKTDLPWLDDNVYLSISRNAGVFNPTPEILKRFAHRYLDDSKLIDMLMSVNYKERFMPLQPSCQFIHFESIYPYFVERPWTQALKGKKVLVVHPYAESIKKQFARKDKIYPDKEILPDFELITMKAVQSSAYAEVPFKDWFEALKYMENQIAAIDFDICLLGCGAYGLPLAAFIKRMGKQALHLGGGVQLLFGIKGRRWEVEYKELTEKGDFGYNVPFKLNLNYYDLFNEYWINPSGDEVPKQAKSVEGACYW